MNRIDALVFVHGLVTLGLAGWMEITDRSNQNLALGIIYYATSFSECGLLALWLTLGLSSRINRFLTSLLGTAYIWLLALFMFNAWSVAELMIVVPAIIFGCILSLAAVLSVASRWRPGFCLVREHTESTQSEKEQFSLRHLFLFTVAVSMVLTGAELIKTFASAGVVTEALLCIVIVVCFVEAILAAIWSSLGQGRMTIKIAAAIGLAAVTGLIPPFYFLGDPWLYAITSGITTLAQVITIASLLVVRSAGFRLIRRTAPQAPFEEPSDMLAHPLD